MIFFEYLLPLCTAWPVWLWFLSENGEVLFGFVVGWHGDGRFIEQLQLQRRHYLLEKC